MWRVAIGHRDYPLLMSGAALLNMLALQAPLLMLPTTFGVAAAGVYFLAFRVLVLPTTTIGTAVGQVFFGEAAKTAGSSLALRSKSLRLTRVLIVVNAPVFITIACLGSTLFTIVFGDKWATAGRFAQILAPMALLWSLANPLSGLLLVGKRLKESLFFSAADLVVKVSGVLIGARLDNIDVAVGIVAVGGALLCTISIWRFLRVAGIGLAELSGEMARALACSLPLAIAELVAAVLLPAHATAALVLILVPATWLFGWTSCVRTPT